MALPFSLHHGVRRREDTEISTAAWSNRLTMSGLGGPVNLNKVLKT